MEAANCKVGFNLFPLEDEKGFYGIGKRLAGSEEIKPVYCLRPGKVFFEKPAVGLHGLPRNLKPRRIKSIYEHSLFVSLRDAWTHGIPRIAGPLPGTQRDQFNHDQLTIDELNDRLREKVVMRHKYYGRASQAKKKVNGLIKKSLAVADQNAITMARRFDGNYRGTIYEYGSSSIRALQLLNSFPVLGFRLSSVYVEKTQEKPQPLIIYDEPLRYNPSQQLYPTIGMVECGNKLKIISEAYGIPYALRKVKPLAAALAYNFYSSHWANNPALFNELIYTYLPHTSMEQFRWFLVLNEIIMKIKRILFRTTDNTFEIENIAPIVKWFAKNINYRLKLLNIFDSNIDLTDYMVAGIQDTLHGARAFSFLMNYENVKAASIDWHNKQIEAARITRLEELKKPYPEPWVASMAYPDGYTIEPITKYEDLIKEGDDMHHCISSYHPQIISGYCYIYSVKKDNKKIATVELIKEFWPEVSELLSQVAGRPLAIPKIIRVAQARGPCNARPDNATMETIYHWLKSSAIETANE